MRLFYRLRCYSFSAAMLLPILTLTQCEKKDAPGQSLNQDQESSGKQSTPFGEHAEKLGAIALLPKDTELYVGSVQLKKHVEAIKASSWWKDLGSLIDDKTPAADTSNEVVQTLKGLWGDDFFVAGGAGFADGLKFLKEFNRFYTEFNFRAMMAGGAASLKGGALPAAGAEAAIIMPLLNDPVMLKRGVEIIKGIDAVPYLVGIKTADAQAKLDKLMSDKVVAKLEEKKIPVSEHKTAEGHVFKTAMIDAGILLDDATVNRFMKGLPSGVSAESKAEIEELVKVVRSKKVQLAWGVVDGQIILAGGKNLDHLKFAKDPSESLLAHPALKTIAPHAGKNLVSLAFVNKETMLAIHDDQPIIPMLRGVVSAMKENAVFASVGNVLSAQIDELAPLEEAAFGRQAQDAAGVVWWDNGLKGEFSGGLEPKFFEHGKALNYAKLLDGKKVLFGITYHGNPTYAKEVRAWMEKLFGVLYVGAKELAKTGVAGAQGQQQVAFFDMLILPTLQKVYQSEKDLAEKGLGNELAIVLDLEGKGTGIPGAPEESFPRLYTVSEVKNRTEIANSWKAINETLTGVAAMMGAKSGGDSLLPEAKSSENHGFTTWEYEMELFSGDLSPNSTINDKHLILSTSKPAALSVAAMLADAPVSELEGCLWKADAGLLVELIGMASGLAPNKNPEQAANIQQFLKFMKPFKAMKGRLFEEGGVWKNHFEWEIVDPVSFD